MAVDEVRPGYKRTEVGIIPEDWEVRTVGDSQPFVTSGSRGWARYYSDYGAPMVRITNLQRGSIRLDMGPIRYVAIPASSSEGARTSLQDEDILISITADIGIIGFVDSSLRKPAYINQHIALLRLCSSEIHPQFVAYFLTSAPVQNLFRAITDAGAKAGINLPTVRGIPFALPPKLLEQQLISQAVSDIQIICEGLERLIAKQRDLKQAAMQELLRPRSPWVTSRIGVIAPLQRGFDLPGNKVVPGPFPIVYSNGRSGNHHKAMIKGPGVITGRSGTLGSVHFVEEAFWPHNTTLWVTDFTNCDPKFIFYLFSSLNLQNYGGGSGVPTLNRNDLHDISVSVPTTIQEQKHIGVILTDMDAAITALEARLAKYREFKRGMMRDLLTGAIRLV